MYIPSTIYDTKTDNLYILLNMYPMPTNIELQSEKIYYIGGGIKFGGRYPDIIINKNDIEFGNKYITEASLSPCNSMNQNITKIINYIHKLYFTDQILKYKSDGTVDSDLWKTNIDDTTLCFMKNILDCVDAESCNKKKLRKLTYTNISMLPYFIGDCREHAFITAFILNSFIQQYKKYNKVGILYTKAYSIDETTNMISYLEDHVFCIYCTNEMSEIYIIDPLYSKKQCVEQLTQILYDHVKPSFIDPYSIKKFKFIDTDIDRIKDFINAKMYLHCGNIYVNNSIVKKIYNIPLYYNGRLETINDIYLDDKMYFYGKKFDKPNNLSKWSNFSDWCIN